MNVESIDIIVSIKILSKILMFVGFFMFYKFGKPNKMSQHEINQLLSDGTTSKEINLKKRCYIYSILSIVMVVIGFILQITIIII